MGICTLKTDTTEKRQRRKKECAINKTTTDDCRRVTEALRKVNNRLQCFPVFMISVWFWITAILWTVFETAKYIPFEETEWPSH